MNSCGDSSFGKEYLKRLLRALNGLKNPVGNEDELAGSSREIKLAADVSLALTAYRSYWSRALMHRISSVEENRPALRKFLGPKKFEAIMAQRVRYRSRLILQTKLKHATCRGLEARQSSASLYRFFCSNKTSSRASLVKRRESKLQRLVPGGKSMDTNCLLRETADYITSLTSQKKKWVLPIGS